MVCKECGSHRVVERVGNSKYLRRSSRDNAHLDFLQCKDCGTEYVIRDRKVQQNLELSRKRE